MFKKQQKTDIFGFTNICSFAKDLLARTLNVVGFRKQSNDFQSALTDWYHCDGNFNPFHATGLFLYALKKSEN